MTTQTTVPPASIEIFSLDGDPIAAGALIGYVVPLDYPENHWAALLFDFSDDTTSTPAYRWSKSLASAELAEAYVRTHYQAAIPGILERSAVWAADVQRVADAWASPTWPN